MGHLFYRMFNLHFFKQCETFNLQLLPLVLVSHFFIALGKKQSIFKGYFLFEKHVQYEYQHYSK